MILRICCSQTALAFHDYAITIQNENHVCIEELLKAPEVKEKSYCFKSSSLIYHMHYYLATTDKLATQAYYLHIITPSPLGCSSSDFYFPLSKVNFSFSSLWLISSPIIHL